MTSDDEWIDVEAAAERHGCSTKTIQRLVKREELLARSVKIPGRDGRQVIKNLVRVSDLDEIFGQSARERNVRVIREAAPPLSSSQRAFIGKVLLEHLRDRDAKQKKNE
ncbi:hypothetical protein [Neomicrococcus aestuarii]|uniref:Helix-turn-helix domain-containing protein n=1 Tax=Neomicrococcus aestuarii TaxID=556325 RepID=A0A1L2ZKQ2_9MICC|nr:hypothetical protein [Neomicrococcus aestuarii]APF39934.1 hypothetical protein BHE16_01640 [Neomicrococcus aestuarii]